MNTMISRCKDTNIIRINEILFRNKLPEQSSQCWRVASTPLRICRCSNPLELDDIGDSILLLTNTNLP